MASRRRNGAAEGDSVEAVAEVDGQDRVVRWSREAERLTGVRAATPRGRRLCELLEARDLWGNRACVCGLHEALRRGEPVRPFVVDARTALGHPVRLVVQPEAPSRPDERRALVVRLRRDQRRLQDRRRPLHPGERAEPHDERGAGQPALTRREQDVLRLLAAGLPTAAIAQRLGIAGVTVRNHVQRLLDRLGAHSRLAVVALARERGLLE